LHILTTIIITAPGIIITAIAGKPGNYDVEGPGLIARPFFLSGFLAESGTPSYRLHDKLSGEA
jgi:hypothetical protein